MISAGDKWRLCHYLIVFVKISGEKLCVTN